MKTIPVTLPNLEEAVNRANTIFIQQKCGYIVTVTNKDIQPKEPIFLQLQYTDKKTRNIGITHLVHLIGNHWDAAPLETIARTTDQLTKAILDRIALFFDAERRRLYIDEFGTIFDFKNTKIKIYENKTFSINDMIVTYLEKPLPLTRLKSESIIEFKQMENGHIQLFDQLDRRTGKGIFMNSKGEIYRT